MTIIIQLLVVFLVTLLHNFSITFHLTMQNIYTFSTSSCQVLLLVKFIISSR